MKKLLITLLIIISFSSIAQDNKQEELTKNYLDQINEDEYVILDFYAKWCGPCKRIERDVFNNTAFQKYTKKNGIHLVKIDTDKMYEFELSNTAKNSLNVKTLPTIYILSKQELLDILDYKEIKVQKYSKDRDVESFIKALKLKTKKL